MKNELFGWIIKDNPKFFEDNDFEKVIEEHNYYGCETAKINKRQIYKKTLALNSEAEDYCSVELFSCGCGSISHEYLVFLNYWNNAGYVGYPLRAAKQVSSICEYNDFIIEQEFDNMENGTFLLKLK